MDNNYFLHLTYKKQYVRQRVVVPKGLRLSCRGDMRACPFVRLFFYQET